MNNILLVEDELIEREALKKIIYENFSEIDSLQEAFNSEVAIKKIDETDFDLVFMDIKIPGINGLELSKYIKKNSPACSIVITTAHDEFDFAHTAIKINVNDFLLKPIRKDKIIQAVKKYCIDKKKILKTKEECFLIELSNSIIKNNYFEAIDLSKQLIDCIYENNDENLHKRWDEVSEAINHIIVSIKSLNISKYNDLELMAKKILSNHRLYTDKYLLKQNLISFIKTIFETLLDRKKTFNGDIRDVKSYIEINIKRNITLDEISNYFNISPYYMSKLFKKKTGTNFVEYVSSRKIDLSKEMLTHTNMRILNIALELGFNEPNYFSKVFKKSVGLTPTDYRNKTTN
jgi:YesN/AraC family two-component response regulator